jgi:hypothetical protein
VSHRRSAEEEEEEEEAVLKKALLDVAEATPKFTIPFLAITAIVDEIPPAPPATHTTKIKQLSSQILST